MIPPRRLNQRHIRNHAIKAIGERLGPTGGGGEAGLLGVERDGNAVIVRVNSGGNALAVEPYLRGRGYCVEPTGGNPGGYGCAVKVTLRAAS